MFLFLSRLCFWAADKKKTNKQNNNINNNNEKEEEEEKSKKGTWVSEKKIVFRENIYYKLSSFPAKRSVCL